MKESAIERKGCEFLEHCVVGNAGNPILVRTIKLGDQGWPDRAVFVLVVYGPPSFFFMEWKQPGKKKSLTPAQERRIPRLRQRGFPVCIVDSTEEAVEALRQFLNGAWKTHPLFTGGF